MVVLHSRSVQVVTVVVVVVVVVTVRFGLV